MEISGKLIALLPAVQGTSSKGAWTKQDIIIETAEQYPKKVCITFFKGYEQIQKVEIGTNLKVFINVESQEYNGKWYTNVNAWKFEATSQPKTQSCSSPNFVEPANLTRSNDSVDDLPF